MPNIRFSPEQRREGTYYSSIEETWATEEVEFAHEDLTVLRRSPEQAQQIPEYTAVRQNVVSPIGPALEAGRPSSCDCAVTFECDIVGRNPAGATVAHLLPHAEECCCAYYKIAEAIVGVEALSEEEAQCLISGALSETPEGTKRVSFSGLKHSPLNKILLVQSGVFLDEYPCVLILPILDDIAAKAWTPAADYWALVCCGGVGTFDQDEEDAGRPSSCVPSSHVYRCCCFSSAPYELCTPSDLKEATTTLRWFLRGLFKGSLVSLLSLVLLGG